jgi:hypothetical protein
MVTCPRIVCCALVSARVNSGGGGGATKTCAVGIYYKTAAITTSNVHRDYRGCNMTNVRCRRNVRTAIYNNL